MKRVKRTIILPGQMKELPAVSTEHYLDHLPNYVKGALKAFDKVQQVEFTLERGSVVRYEFINDHD